MPSYLEAPVWQIRKIHPEKFYKILSMESCFFYILDNDILS